MSEVRKELMEATGLTQSRKQSDDEFREKLITAASDLPDKKWKALSKPTQKWATKAIDAFNDDGEIIEFDDADDAADEADDADAEEEAPPKKKAPAGKTSKKAKEAEPDEEEEEKPKRTRTRAKSKDEDAEADQEGDDGDAGDGETDGDEPEGEEAEGDDDNDAGEEAGEEEDEDMASKPRRTTDKASSKKAATDKARSGKTATKTAAKSNGAGKGESKAGALAYAKKAMIKDPSITAKDLATRMEKAGYSMSSHTLSTTRSQFRHSVKVMQEAGLLKKALIT
jgi:hypothetical protein